MLRRAYKSALVAFQNGDFKEGASLLGDLYTNIFTIGEPRLRSVDPTQKVTFFDDFLAALIDTRISSTAGAGTGNAAATTVAGAVGGVVTLKSASDDGTHAQNFSMITLDQLNFKANQGGLIVEARLAIDDVSEAYFFIGFTDTISTTVEGPIFMAAGDIDSDATDACGVVYDIDATTDRFTQGGVKNNADTVPVIGDTAPADNVKFTVRVEVTPEGAVRGFINGSPIGDWTANAVTASTALTPCIVIGNRSANQVTASIDYLWAQGNRT